MSESRTEMIWERISKHGLKIYGDYEKFMPFVDFCGTKSELSDLIGFGDDEEIGTGVVPGVIYFNG